MFLKSLVRLVVFEPLTTLVILENSGGVLENRRHLKCAMLLVILDLTPPHLPISHALYSLSNF